MEIDLQVDLWVDWEIGMEIGNKVAMKLKVQQHWLAATARLGFALALFCALSVPQALAAKAVDQKALMASVAAAGNPHTAVKVATEDLLSRLVQVIPIYESEPAAFYKEVDGSLAPFIDFDGFSRSVMAKFYKRASPEQRKEFASIFRASLIETYAKALVSFDNQEVEVLKPTKKQKKPNKAAITLKVTGKDGSVFLVDYSLKIVDDKWKLSNLRINGINVGLQFKSQFKAAMDNNKQDIDIVISKWSLDA